MRGLLESQGISSSEMDLYLTQDVLHHLFLEFHANLSSICDYKFTLVKAVSQSIAKLIEENSEGCALNLLYFCRLLKYSQIKSEPIMYIYYVP